MRAFDAPSGWGWISRALHWTMAALILFQLGFGLWMTRFVPDLLQDRHPARRLVLAAVSEFEVDAAPRVLRLNLDDPALAAGRLLHRRRHPVEPGGNRSVVRPTRCCSSWSTPAASNTAAKSTCPPVGGGGDFWKTDWVGEGVL